MRLTAIPGIAHPIGTVEIPVSYFKVLLKTKLDELTAQCDRPEPKLGDADYEEYMRLTILRHRAERVLEQAKPMYNNGTKKLDISDAIFLGVDMQQFQPHYD